MIDAGQLRGTLSETLGTINAANLDIAHQRLASGHTVGKLALVGWGD
jgi:NADPH2:quinone reductase